MADYAADWATEQIAIECARSQRKKAIRNGECQPRVNYSHGRTNSAKRNPKGPRGQGRGKIWAPYVESRSASLRVDVPSTTLGSPALSLEGGHHLLSDTTINSPHSTHSHSTPESPSPLSQPIPHTGNTHHQGGRINVDTHQIQGTGGDTYQPPLPPFSHFHLNQSNAGPSRATAECEQPQDFCLSRNTLNLTPPPNTYLPFPGDRLPSQPPHTNGMSACGTRSNVHRG